MGDDAPGEPLSPMVEATTQMHEVYLALREGGFSRLDAIAVVVGLLAKLIESDDA